LGVAKAHLKAKLLGTFVQVRAYVNRSGIAH
jgi:hypothetical protein